MDELRRDLELARRQMRDLGEGVQRLEGTFSGIERHRVTLLEHDIKTQARLQPIEARMDALQRRQPPAA